MWLAQCEPFQLTKVFKKVVMLFNSAGEKQDKFATKPAESGVRRAWLLHTGLIAHYWMQGAKTYVVTGLAWSPDSNKLESSPSSAYFPQPPLLHRLAVAQSDNIVFVYKLGQGDATKWYPSRVWCHVGQISPSLLGTRKSPSATSSCKQYVAYLKSSQSL